MTSKSGSHTNGFFRSILPASLLGMISNSTAQAYELNDLGEFAKAYPLGQMELYKNARGTLAKYVVSPSMNLVGIYC